MAYQTTRFKFSKLKYICNKNQISFEAENQINKQGNNHELSGVQKKWESLYIDKDSNHMFISFLCTFLNILQASFPVKYKRMKDKNHWITQRIKKYLTNKKQVSMPSLSTAIIPKAKGIILNTVKP